MDDKTTKLMSAAAAAAEATICLIEEARCGSPDDTGLVSDAERELADSLRLLIESFDKPTPEETQLFGAIVRFLEDR